MLPIDQPFMAARLAAIQTIPRLRRSPWRGSPSMFENSVPPGAAWIEVVSRSTLQAFSSAFCADPILEAVIVAEPIFGVRAIYDFFRATRSMYEHIAFVDEIRSSRRACLEWDGVFQGKSISGATILIFEASGAIERIRLFHYPHKQLNAFSAELARRQSPKTASINPRSRSAV
jgi:hypothetical protein